MLQDATSKIWRNLASLLPRPLVYHCALRLFAHATTEQHSSTIVPELTFMEALRRW